MEDFIPILTLLIITGLFIIGFVFSAFFKGLTSVIHKEEKIEIVVAHMIESLRKICPVGAKKRWTLVPIGCSLPRIWKKRSVFPVFKSDIVLHGSSLIVRSPVSIIKDLIFKPIYWDEWDSSYFSSSMKYLENDSSNLKRDKYMQCILVGKDTKSYSQENASMFCFKNQSSDKVRWILFWNIMNLDWWFFLIQPAMRKQDLNRSLLTIVRGTDTSKYEKELAKEVWLKIRNIKETAELHSFKVSPLNPLLEYSTSWGTSLAEPTQHPPFCKKRSHTDSCSGKVCTEGKTLPENSSEVLLQIVTSSGCETTRSGSSKKFHVRFVGASSTSSIREGGNSNCGPQDDKGRNIAKSRSWTTAMSETVSNSGDSKQLLQEGSCKLQTKNMSAVRNSYCLLPETTNSKRSNSPVSRSETNISRSKSSSDSLQDVSKTTECDPGPRAKRGSIVKSILRVSKLLSSNSKSDTDISKCVVAETGSDGEMYDEKRSALVSHFNTAECSAIKNSGLGTGNSIFYDSGMSSEPYYDLTVNTSGRETIPKDESNSVSNDKSVICEGNCFPMCDVCLKAAFDELSDYEVLLPSVSVPEERIADFLTKGNYCAAELQTEVHEVSQVKTFAGSEKKNSNGRWTHVSSNKDIDLYFKAKEERSLKVMSYLCQTNLPVSSDRVWNIIRNPRFRFMCDETAKRVTVIEELPEQQKIVYTYHEFGGLLKKEAMDFCLLHSERVEDSKYSMAYFSVEYENCPLSAAVRGMLFPSGWVIEKLKGNSDECKVSYLTQVVVNRPDSLLIQESSNIVLQCIQNLQTYCISAPESIRSSNSK